MYAIIRSGGKQYKVSEGDSIRVELLNTEAGGNVSLDDVLSVHDGKKMIIGRPTVDGAKVEAKVVRQGRGPKIRIYKFRRRKGFARRQGHRQDYTELLIEKISV